MYNLIVTKGDYYMNKKTKKLASAAAAITMAAAFASTLGACAANPDLNRAGAEDFIIPEETENQSPETQSPEVESPELQLPTAPAEEQPAEEQSPAEEQPAISVKPQVKTVSYLSVTSDGVNLRSGAGTSYSSRGTAEKSTLYAYSGETGGWYKTGYKNKTAYLASKYCTNVQMLASDDERIEAVIAEGAKLLGTAYVFGAVRYHDGSGKLLKNFTTGEFDCSSLMQYIFYKGAHVNLQVNTRTQIYQGKTVTRSQLKRGDLMFFTNASRKNNVGIERVGHVALYLGDNWILHTASDYAKIEQITSQRWSYFIQGQRIF